MTLFLALSNSIYPLPMPVFSLGVWFCNPFACTTTFISFTNWTINYYYIKDKFFLILVAMKMETPTIFIGFFRIKVGI